MKYVILIATLFVSIWIAKDLKPDFKAGVRPLGIDVSHHNDILDWSILKGKVTFRFIKATEGSEFKDPEFERNWAEAKRNGITRGAYCFLSPESQPRNSFRISRGV